MYIVFILLKAAAIAKGLNNYLETSGMSRKDSVFSSVAINSIVPLLFVPPPKTGFQPAQEGDVVGGTWPAWFGHGCTECSPLGPAISTWVSGTIGFCPGAALKKVDNGDEIMIGSGRTKPLRSQLGMEFSSVFITRVSMA